MFAYRFERSRTSRNRATKVQKNAHDAVTSAIILLKKYEIVYAISPCMHDTFS